MTPAALIATAVLVVSPGLALAAGPTIRGLEKLEPTTRLMQVCDVGGQREMRRDKQLANVSTIIVDAMSTPEVTDGTIEGDGGALKQNGRWFRFDFTCRLAPDKLSVMAFSYQIGDEIPEEQWEDHGLWR